MTITAQQIDAAVSAAFAVVLGYAPAQAVGVTLMFFSLSFARSWALRAVFRRMQ